jgi:hypothetical protein
MLTKRQIKHARSHLLCCCEAEQHDGKCPPLAVVAELAVAYESLLDLLAEYAHEALDHEGFDAVPCHELRRVLEHACKG